MYKLYEKGHLYQVGFGSGYGYIHEIGEDDYENSFFVMYERRFSNEISNIKELSTEKYFIGRFMGSLLEECRENAGHINEQDMDDAGFRCSIYRGNSTKEFKNAYIYVKCLGNYLVPRGLEIPKYFRELDINLMSGTHKWIIKTSYGDFVKQRKTVNGIECVPPNSLSFNKCTDWWEKELTLETWNDEYCLRVIEQRYLEHPEERPITMSFDEVIATSPTKKWHEHEVDKERIKWYSEVEAALKQFIKMLSSAEKISTKEAKKATKELCLRLNEIQSEGINIETQDRDDLFIFITNLLRTKKAISAIDILNEYRDW